MKYMNILVVGLLVSPIAFAQEWPRAKKRPVERAEQQKDDKAAQQGQQPRHVRPERQPQRERRAVSPQQNPYERIFGSKPKVPALGELQRQLQQQQQLPQQQPRSNTQPVVKPSPRDITRFDSHRGPPARVEPQQQFPGSRRRDPVNLRSARDIAPPAQTGRPRYDDRINDARGRTDSRMKRNPAVINRVNEQSRWATRTYTPIFERRSPVYQRYVDSFRSYHNRYPGWSRYRFFGGGYYALRPIFNIEVDFYNPLVYWFFVPTYSVDYYRPWYGSYLERYDVLRQPFRYSGYFYPTESLRQLLFGVSAMAIEKQVAFREAIAIVTDMLARRTTEVAYVAANLGRGDIVVTHYEMVGYDRAVALEGFVNVDDRLYNFKAIVDLRYPDSSDVFVTGAMDREPTALEMQALDRLNARVGNYEGYDDEDYYDDDDY